MYGNQSHCVDDAKMKKFCYCTDLLEEKKVHLFRNAG